MALSFGTGFEYNGGSTVSSGTAVCQLDSTHFVVAYAVSNVGEAVVGTISAGSISYGTPVQWTSTNVSSGFVIEKLDSTHFILAYNSNESSNHGESIIGIVSGTTITYGSKVTYNSGVTSKNAIGLLDSTHYVIGFQRNDDTQKGYVIVASISGTTPTFGTMVKFQNSALTSVGIAVLDATHFAVSGGGSSTVGTSYIGVVSAGTTITLGSGVNYESGSVTIDYMDASPIDSTHFSTSWGNATNTQTIIGTVSSGNVITFGSAVQVSANAGIQVSTNLFDATTYTLSMRESTDGKCYPITFVGDVPTVGSSADFVSGTNPNVQPMATIDATTFVVAWSQNSNDHGQVKIGTLTPPTSVKTIDGLAKASVAVFDGLAIGSVKNINGLE